MTEAEVLAKCAAVLGVPVPALGNDSRLLVCAVSERLAIGQYLALSSGTRATVVCPLTREEFDLACAFNRRTRDERGRDHTHYTGIYGGDRFDAMRRVPPGTEPENPPAAFRCYLLRQM